MRRLYLFTMSAVMIALAPPSAESVLFDFNSLAAGASSSSGPDGIETYMESMYGSNITVNWGAKAMKGKPDAAHPASNQLYLANSDNAPDRGPMAGSPYWHADPKDTYLINRWNDKPTKTCGPTCLSDRIVMIFDVPIVSAEWDWEIFPINGKGKADITAKADGVTIFYSSLTTAADKALGDLGHAGPFFFATPVNKLEFIDWTDAPIGIDKLQITKRQIIPLQVAPVPDDPPAVLILAAGLGALMILASRGRRHTAPQMR